MWCLPVGYRVWSLLQPNYLSVCKLAAIVHKRHCPDRSAHLSGAQGWLVDLSTVNLHLNGVITFETAEKSDFHVRYDGRCTNDQALYGDKFVRV